MDEEKQRDELAALASIYNEEEFSYHTENNLYHITSKVFINLPEKYFFTYKDTRQPGSQREKINISHLPPVILLITLPSDYPSVSSPKFTIRSTWLSVHSISKLCKEFDRLWETNKNEEILFTCIGFLQLELLEVLNIQECINIDSSYTAYKIKQEKIHHLEEIADVKEIINANQGKSNNSKIEEKMNVQKTYKKLEKNVSKRKVRNKRYRQLLDPRAVSDVILGKNLVQILVDYNELRKQIEFRKNIYSCKICFTDKLGEHCTQFTPCAHTFCKECIFHYFQNKIKEGSVLNIFCPEDKCNSEASPGQVRIFF